MVNHLAKTVRWDDEIPSRMCYNSYILTWQIINFAPQNQLRTSIFLSFNTNKGQTWFMRFWVWKWIRFQAKVKQWSRKRSGINDTWPLNLKLICLNDYRQNNGWALKMLAIEALYLVIPLANIYMANLYLGQDFTQYGAKVLQYSANFGSTSCSNTPSKLAVYSPMEEMFPTMSECVWHNYGKSGTIEKKTLLCLLPMNVINSKARILSSCP